MPGSVPSSRSVDILPWCKRFIAGFAKSASSGHTGGYLSKRASAKNANHATEARARASRVAFPQTTAFGRSPQLFAVLILIAPEIRRLGLSLVTVLLKLP